MGAYQSCGIINVVPETSQSKYEWLWLTMALFELHK